MSDATRAISALDQRREPRNGRRRLSLGTLPTSPDSTAGVCILASHDFVVESVEPQDRRTQNLRCPSKVI